MKRLALAMLICGCSPKHEPRTHIFYRCTTFERNDGMLVTITQESNAPLPKTAW